jgi:opacity protein-like surface antigen
LRVRLARQDPQDRPAHKDRQALKVRLAPQDLPASRVPKVIQDRPQTSRNSACNASRPNRGRLIGGLGVIVAWFGSQSTVPTGTSSTSSKDDWFGTVRGRRGYAFNNWLLYGTGGFAWMHDTSTRTVIASAVPALVGQSASASSTLTGWTAGGGVEVGVTANWIARLEYLHMDFSPYTYHFVYSPTSGNRTINQKLTSDIVRVALSYKFN